MLTRILKLTQIHVVLALVIAFALVQPLPAAAQHVDWPSQAPSVSNDIIPGGGYLSEPWTVTVVKIYCDPFSGLCWPVPEVYNGNDYEAIWWNYDTYQLTNTITRIDSAPGINNRSQHPDLPFSTWGTRGLLYWNGTLAFEVPNYAWQPCSYMNPPDYLQIGGCTFAYNYTYSTIPHATGEIHWSVLLCDLARGCYSGFGRDLYANLW